MSLPKGALSNYVGNLSPARRALFDRALLDRALAFALGLTTASFPEDT